MIQRQEGTANNLALADSTFSKEENTMGKWVNLPPPPAPTGINMFPPDPPRCVAWSDSLPNRHEDFHAPPGSLITGGYVEYRKLHLTVTGWWTHIFEVTATSEIPYEKTVVVQQGTSITDTTMKTFGASLGVKAQLIDIGANLSQQTTHSITLTQSTTITRKYTVTPKSTKAISAILWQKNTSFHLKGELFLHMKWKDGHISETTKQIDSLFSDVDEVFPLTQYPPPSDEVEVLAARLSP